MKKSIGNTIGEIFKLNLRKITRNFYVLTVASVVVGLIIYVEVSSIWSKVEAVKDGSLPLLIQSQKTDNALGDTKLVIEKLYDATEPGVRDILLLTIQETNKVYKLELNKLVVMLSSESAQAIKTKLQKVSSTYIQLFEKGIPDTAAAYNNLANVKGALMEVNTYTLETIATDFNASQAAKNNATIVIVFTILAAIGGMIITSLVLTGVVSQPVTNVADSLAKNTLDIESVLGEISEGAKAQTEIVKNATKDLEDMIINIIQGSITLSVEKQSEISGVFAEFLRQFVERTSAEIAMGMMTVSQQSQEARSEMDKFVKELANVEGNIKDQETAVLGMVDAVRLIASSNEDIKKKTITSTEVADKATRMAAEGQERIGVISEELQDVRKSSEGVAEITESLAKITENIKILALNMSLKVEDIRDDTGKSYGFEAMSARVQELAEEVEGLLENSKEMILPTIKAITKVSGDAEQAKELITEVARSIKEADEESKAIAIEIDTQSVEISRVEKSAQGLSELAKKSTETISEQTKLVKDVDEMLGESVTLVDSVSAQTNEANEAARKVNDMMEELKASMSSIEEGTGLLTEKSVELSEIFETISVQSAKNLDGAERLEVVSNAVRDVAGRLSYVVQGGKGEGNGAAQARGKGSQEQVVEDVAAAGSKETPPVA
ncbi:MAG: hypothetical protein KAR06_06240 [Deltaproteobacteria bacterium]|nr:hypothetical protein [Deltaproteobacteria bacterium]